MKKDRDFLIEVRHRRKRTKERHKLDNNYQITNTKVLRDYFKKEEDKNES